MLLYQRVQPIVGLAINKPLRLSSHPQVFDAAQLERPQNMKFSALTDFLNIYPLDPSGILRSTLKMPNL